MDTDDLGSPTDAEFRNVHGKVRVRVHLDEDVKQAYGGGFIGLLRPELYERMLAAIPDGVIRFDQQVDRIEQDERAVTLHFADGSTAEHDVLIGADGIDSLVRRTLWGDEPKREHRLHIFGGFTFAEVDGTAPNMCVAHRTTAPRRAAGRRSGNKGRDGHQWWVLTATDPDAPAPADLKAAATELAAGFPAPLPGPDRRDRRRRTCSAGCCATARRSKQWSKGRITLCGDAAHATSPYAAYGAGMSIEDGYFFGRALRGVDLTDLAAVRQALQSYEDPRKPHTAKQVQHGADARQDLPPRARPAAAGPRLRLRPHAVPAEDGRRLQPARDQPAARPDRGLSRADRATPPPPRPPRRTGRGGRGRRPPAPTRVLAYSFAADLEDENRILSIEIWADRAALDAHMDHDHTAEFLRVAPGPGRRRAGHVLPRRAGPGRED